MVREQTTFQPCSSFSRSYTVSCFREEKELHFVMESARYSKDAALPSAKSLVAESVGRWWCMIFLSTVLALPLRKYLCPILFYPMVKHCHTSRRPNGNYVFYAAKMLVPPSVVNLFLTLIFMYCIPNFLLTPSLRLKMADGEKSSASPGSRLTITLKIALVSLLVSPLSLLSPSSIPAR